jgi:DNA-binding transcriptional LysR family regulator
LHLKQLRYLTVLAREKHFGRAAKALSISQSALSQAIQQIEKHFHVPVVLRQQAGFQGFTPEGAAILEWARHSLEEHDRLISTSDIGGLNELQGKLRIGLAPVAMSIVALLTDPFTERHPGITISALAMNLPEVERGLKEFEIDVGVTYLDGITASGLRSYVLYDEAYYLLVPDGHYLSDRQTIAWREVGELPLCMLTPDLYNRVILNNIFSRVGAVPKAVIETNCSLGLFAHMRSGKWLTVVPHSYFYLLGGWAYIRSVPIVDPSTTSTMGLVVHERNPIAPAVYAFVETAEEAQIGLQLARYKPRL